MVKQLLEFKLLTQVSIINKFFVLLFLSCTMISCTIAQEGNEQKRELTDSTSDNNRVTELSQEQQAAFAALNTLQTSTDERNRLYSTFANVDQPFYPADTSFEISQSELLVFLEQFISKHCQDLAPEVQSELAKSAVLAQDKYKVLHCARNEMQAPILVGSP